MPRINNINNNLATKAFINFSFENLKASVDSLAIFTIQHAKSCNIILTLLMKEM